MLVLFLLFVLAWSLHGAPAFAGPDAAPVVGSTHHPEGPLHDGPLGIMHCQFTGSCSHSATIVFSLTFSGPNPDDRPFELASYGPSQTFYSHFRPPRLPAHV